LTGAGAPPGTAWTRTLAWAVIVAIAAVFAFRAATSADPAVAAHAVEMRARTVVGAREIGAPTDAANSEIDALDTGTPAVRQGAAVLAAEMLGAADAERRLARIDADARAAGGDVAERQRILVALYAGGDSKQVASRVEGLDPADRARIAAMGWAGRLALAPEGLRDPAPRRALLDGARRTAVVGAAMTGTLCVALLAGCAAFVALAVVFATRRTALRNDVAAAAGGVGAETFAVWFALVLASGLAWRDLVPPERQWIGVAGPSMLAPAALLWPLVRGTRWSDVRRACGLHRGGGFAKEIACGVAGWFASLPLLAAGVLGTYVLLRAAGNGSVPPGVGAHPAASWAQSASRGELAFLVFVACVAAPVVEETMFRGALYGDLRAATSAWPRALSVAFSVTVVSALFAAIHPQGWVAIPVLGAIATSLALAREWRGSLVAPIVMHALVNTSTFLAVIALRVLGA
jgi:membrane protease YdiL (CAAX protease family)